MTLPSWLSPGDSPALDVSLNSLWLTYILSNHHHPPILIIKTRFPSSSPSVSSSQSTSCYLVICSHTPRTGRKVNVCLRESRSEYTLCMYPVFRSRHEICYATNFYTTEHIPSTKLSWTCARTIRSLGFGVKCTGWGTNSNTNFCLVLRIYDMVIA